MAENHSVDVPEVWDAKKTAEYLGVDERKLAKWRMNGRGPAFVRYGRLIRYPVPDLVAWVEANKVPAGAA